jgi:DNA-binding IclR family transcriptional regulator
MALVQRRGYPGIPRDCGAALFRSCYTFAVCLWSGRNPHPSLFFFWQSMNAETESTSETYSAPALAKGLDIIEMLCRTDRPLSKKEIAESLGRTVGEIYRMLMLLVKRDYVAQIDDNYVITNKMFMLAHIRPMTHRLLLEARPIMERLSTEVDQSCHLTVWGSGSQLVVAKVDAPSGMGFGVRLGSELDVFVSASGRVLLAFQQQRTQDLRIAEVLARQAEQVIVDPNLGSVLQAIRKRGFESARSAKVVGLQTVSYPITDLQGYAIAALTVPYTARVNKAEYKSIKDVEVALGAAALTLRERLSGRGLE